MYTGATPLADPDRSIPVLVRRPPPPPFGPPPELARSFILVAAVTAAMAALLLLALHPDRGSAAPVALGYVAIAVAAALGWRAPLAWSARILAALLAAAVALMGLAAWMLGWGLATPALLIVPLLVCTMTTVAGWRAGSALALGALAMLWLLAGWAPAEARPGGGPASAQMLAAHALALAVGLAVGTIIGRTVVKAVQAAHKREQRFRRLLSLAADVYWEIDDRYQLVAAGQHDTELRALQSHIGLGAVPWELPRFVCDAETLDVLMADLETRSPFRDRAFSWRGSDGGLRSYLASGEPRFDARGVFKGYWGVARDVTAMHAARAQVQATETRYQELFGCIPSPLVLHRLGRIIDANPAAVRLFGHADLAAMVGRDLFSAYEGSDSRVRARRRAEQLHAMPDGAALPVANFQLLVQGKTLAVQATGVRVQAQGGPALLSIFVDMTERLAAEEAVRRSEAMLAHLVATSPDLITLTDASSGRYAMVNQAFERVIGWRAAEAVGRTSLELGVWRSEQARQEFVTRLREHGVVSDLPVVFITKGGGEVALLVSAARFVLDRRDYIVINARDVSVGERDRMEREAILNNASIGIAVTREQRFVLVNPHFERIYGWGRGELIGQSGAVVWPDEAAYREVGRLAGPALARGEPVELERSGRRKDGSGFLVLMRGHAIDPERPALGGTAWIVEDITERRGAEQSLARARDEAEAANRAKSAFLANTSHELRTPLNGIIGLARMARGNDISEALRRQYLDQIADSAQSLAGIISDILDLSKIEAGKLQLETTSFDLAELLQTLEHTYQTLASARGLALKVEVDATLQGGVRGDPLRVRQIVTNFLSNALKFTDQGQVRVRAQRLASGEVRIDVSDSGPGIESQALARLFKPFTQADQSTTRRFGGTGLGLSICRELATLMGGEVGVDSQPGQGSRFWAELPLPPSALPAVPPAAAVEGQLAGTRVLMVEDNVVNMMIAVAMLQNWGVQVTQASDGREAVAAVQRGAGNGQPFDAVLMDVQMPVMSGHEATRVLRQMEAGRHLPIIALTAAALVTEREEALRAGMDDFLTKPIDADRLRAALLQRRRARAD